MTYCVDFLNHIYFRTEPCFFMLNSMIFLRKIQIFLSAPPPQNSDYLLFLRNYCCCLMFVRKAGFLPDILKNVIILKMYIWLFCEQCNSFGYKISN